jgi:hypothetical protein
MGRPYSKWKIRKYGGTSNAGKRRLAPTVSVGANIGTLRSSMDSGGRGAAEIWVPTQSVGTRNKQCCGLL